MTMRPPVRWPVAGLTLGGVLPVVVLLLALVGVAYGWLRAHDRAVREQALAEARRDSVLAMGALRDAAVAERDRLRAALADTVAVLEEQAAELASQRDVVSSRFRRASRALAGLRNQVPDTVLSTEVSELVMAEREATEAARAELGVCDQQRTNCEERVANLNRQLVLVDSSKTELDADFRELRAIYAAEVDRKKPPSWGVSAVRMLPAIAAAFLGGFLIGK